LISIIGYLLNAPIDDDDDDDNENLEKEPKKPSIFDYIIHIISFPWKLIFAFIPPAGKNFKIYSEVCLKFFHLLDLLFISFFGVFFFQQYD
jgi:hypothetical protein